MGALGAVTAHADGCTDVNARFDYGDSTAADSQPVTAGSADSAHTYTANGTYTIRVTSGETTTTTATVTDLAAEASGFDPGAHTVPEVQAYVTAHPDALLDVLEAEEAGKARSTLLAWLEAEEG